MTTLRKISVTLLVLTVLSLIGAWIFLLPMVEMGAGFVAKQVCSCVHVGGRSFDDCYADLRRYGPRIAARPLPELGGVKAEIWPIADATAYYHQGTGCTQE
jgi:hypothetical protein